MKTKADKIHDAIREAFTERLDSEFKKLFRRNLTTQWSLMSMQLISRPTNGKPFTVKQKAWVDGFSTGYRESMDMVKP